MKLRGIKGIKDPALASLFEQLQGFTESLASEYGIAPGRKAAISKVPPPPAVVISNVVGANGQISVYLQEQPGGKVVFHEIITSSTLPFDTSLDVQRYGPSASTYVLIGDLGVSKYVGVRSKFADSDFNAPTQWPTLIETGSPVQPNTDLTDLIAALAGTTGEGLAAEIAARIAGDAALTAALAAEATTRGAADTAEASARAAGDATNAAAIASEAATRAAADVVLTNKIRVDIFVNRGSAASYPNSIFLASDRDYVAWISNGSIWRFMCGENKTPQSNIAAIAASLTANDVGYILDVTDFFHRLKWSGTGWAFAPGDRGSNYFIDAVVAPEGVLVGLCNGSTYSYLKADGTLGSYVTKNLTDHYVKNVTSGADVLSAAVAPGISGSTASDGSHVHTGAANTAALDFTHDHDYNNLTGDALADGGGVWNSTHSHTLSGNVAVEAAHTHPGGNTGDGLGNDSLPWEPLLAHTHGLPSTNAASHTHTGTTDSGGGHDHGALTGDAGSHSHGVTGSGSVTGTFSGSGVGTATSNFSFCDDVRDQYVEDLFPPVDAQECGHEHDVTVAVAGSISGSADVSGSTDNPGNHAHSIAAVGGHTHTFSIATGGSHSHSFSSNTDSSSPGTDIGEHHHVTPTSGAGSSHLHAVGTLAAASTGLNTHHHGFEGTTDEALGIISAGAIAVTVPSTSSAHSHAVGSLAVDATGRPPTFTVLKYFVR